MAEQDLMQPKPGDVVKPASPTPQETEPSVQPAATTPPNEVPEVEESNQATAAAPAIADVAPPVVEQEQEMPTPPAEEPKVAVGGDGSQQPPENNVAQETPEPHKTNRLLFMGILLLVLLIVGGALYLMYARDFTSPEPAPIETQETTESTEPEANVQQEDTTSLQYLQDQLNSLDNSTTELTNDTEVGTQLNIGTSNSSSNASEL